MSRIAALATTLLLAACGTPGLDHPPLDGTGITADAIPFTNGVSTLAGTKDGNTVDGDRSMAMFNNPVKVAVGPDDMIYVCEFDGSRLRRIDQMGNVTTVVNQKGFIRPFGILFTKNGTLLVETDNDKDGGHDNMSGSIWKVDYNAGKATILANRIGRPRGMAELPDGRIVVVDDMHHVVRLMDVNTGAMSPLAGVWDKLGNVDGVGEAAKFNIPYDVVVRDDGSLVVVDQGNNKLRSITLDGKVQTLAGGTQGFVDGSMSEAMFNKPQALVQAANGDMYITDENNFRIRRISGDQITTIAGNGTGGWLDDDDPLQAKVYGIEGLALSPDGNTLYFSDGNRGESLPYNRVRMVNLSSVH